MIYPKMIAICGAPQAGKSEIARILHEKHGYEIVDDGYPMRQFAVRHLSLSWDDVLTQEGKAKTFKLPDRDMLVREILGELGNALEEKLGPDIIPYMAYLKIMGNAPGGRFVMPSVRRKQGHFWRSHGAQVIEVKTDYAKIVNEFDRYDASAATARIWNDWLPGQDVEAGKRRLEREVQKFLNAYQEASI